MKKIVCIFTAAVLSLGLTALASSAGMPGERDAANVCESSEKCNASCAVTVTEGTITKYGDELVTEVYSAEREGSRISIEYPVKGNAALVYAIRNWIEYGGAAASDPSAKIKERLMSLTETECIIGTTIMEEYVEDVKVIYSDSKVVTYLNGGYYYGGGAHPMSWKTGATFSKATGEMLTTDYLPPIASMRPMIIEGLLSWSNTPLDEWTFRGEELRKEIEYGVPVITSGGLTLLYSAYEIAPYSSGIPESHIPLSSFRNMLPPAASIFF